MIVDKDAIYNQIKEGILFNKKIIKKELLLLNPREEVHFLFLRSGENILRC